MVCDRLVGLAGYVESLARLRSFDLFLDDDFAELLG